MLGDGTPKYLNSPETPIFHKGKELFGLYEIKAANRNPPRVLIVEGYMDVVALAQYGHRLRCRLAGNLHHQRSYAPAAGTTPR